jgi:hypothetical protein
VYLSVIKSQIMATVKLILDRRRPKKMPEVEKLGDDIFSLPVHSSAVTQLREMLRQAQNVS